MENQDKRRRYVDAMSAERDAWNEVKHTLPGSPGFDEGKWRRWRTALDAVARALDDTRRPQPAQPPRHRSGREW